jgi:hypothetical protein
MAALPSSCAYASAMTNVRPERVRMGRRHPRLHGVEVEHAQLAQRAPRGCPARPGLTVVRVCALCGVHVVGVGRDADAHPVSAGIGGHDLERGAGAVRQTTAVRVRAVVDAVEELVAVRRVDLHAVEPCARITQNRHVGLQGLTRVRSCLLSSIAHRLSQKQ